MKLTIDHFLNLLKSRVALNVYFWVFYILLEFVFNFHSRHGHYYYAQGWYVLFQSVTTLLVMVVVYTNNLWLVPRFFVKRKYARYVFLLILISYLVGLCYALLFEMLDVRFPKIQMEDISLFLSVRVDVPSRWITFFEALGWTFTMVVCAVMFTMAWYMQDYRNQKRKIEEAQKKQVEAELKFLKSQINPHFLFNTLNNLYTLTITKSDMAPEVVSKLSIILRYLLYESNTTEVSFEKEKEIMQAYIDLELLRLTKKDNMHFSFTADRPYQLPPLLWVPVLENVFKHGTRYIGNDHFIDYHFHIAAGKLTITSKNNFKNDTHNNLEKTGGIGLDNLKQRLILLYPQKHSIFSGMEGDHYTTRVNIDLA